MKFFQSIKLLLPALIPSWNFFDIIAPSPRIQFALLNSDHSVISLWQDFRPRPEKVTFLQTFKRLLWNPRWNESLYLVSCAERIMDNYTTHSENEILNRINNDLQLKTAASYLQFRLVYIQKVGGELKKEVTFISRTQEIIWNNQNDS